MREAFGVCGEIKLASVVRDPATQVSRYNYYFPQLNLYLDHKSKKSTTITTTTTTTTTTFFDSNIFILNSIIRSNQPNQLIYLFFLVISKLSLGLVLSLLLSPSLHYLLPFTTSLPRPHPPIRPIHSPSPTLPSTRLPLALRFLASLASFCAQT